MKSYDKYWHNYFARMRPVLYLIEGHPLNEWRDKAWMISIRVGNAQYGNPEAIVTYSVKLAERVLEKKRNRYIHQKRIIGDKILPQAKQGRQCVFTGLRCLGHNDFVPSLADWGFLFSVSYNI